MLLVGCEKCWFSLSEDGTTHESLLNHVSLSRSVQSGPVQSGPVDPVRILVRFLCQQLCTVPLISKFRLP